MKSKDMQPKLLYPAMLSFKTKDKINSFPDQKKNAKGVHAHQTNIARYAKGTGLRRRRNRERKEHKCKKKNVND